MTRLQQAANQMVGNIGYTLHCCSITSMIGAALPLEVLEEAKAAVKAEVEDSILKQQLAVMIDCVDYTKGACSLTEMVGGVLPKNVLENVINTLKELS